MAGGATVLLVDDEPLVMRLLARVIESMGYAVRFATNGVEALETAADNPPALILTDYYMPGLSGVELAAALVRDGVKRCPLILISGDDDEEIVRAGLLCGVDDFLVKGMPFAVLMDRVRFWAQGPFRGLPEHIRRAALETMNRMETVALPVQRMRTAPDALVDRAVLVMADQLLAAPDGFGQTETDRVRFLAVLDQVLDVLARASMVAQLQRVDALVAVVRRLDLPWGEELLALEMPRLGELRRSDMAFAHAAATLSMRVDA